MRDRVTHFVESRKFQTSIIILIIINAVILGLETSSSIMADYGYILKDLDQAILYVFIIEIILRFFAYRWSFFKRPWSVFDLVIIVIAMVPASDAFAALRALRVLRVLRLISVVPAMRKVIEGLLSAIPGIISIATIMSLFFYVFAVIGTHLYSQTFPDWFGTIGNTMFTLFQIMTLESWAMGVVRPVMEQHPYAWAFFITYILVTTFTMLNLFIAIIVNAMQSGSDEHAEENRNEIKEEILDEIKAMEKRILQQIGK